MSVVIVVSDIDDHPLTGIAKWNGVFVWFEMVKSIVHDVDAVEESLVTAVKESGTPLDSHLTELIHNSFVCRGKGSPEDRTQDLPQAILYNLFPVSSEQVEMVRMHHNKTAKFLKSWDHRDYRKWWSFVEANPANYTIDKSKILGTTELSVNRPIHSTTVVGLKDLWL